MIELKATDLEPEEQQEEEDVVLVSEEEDLAMKRRKTVKKDGNLSRRTPMAEIVPISVTITEPVAKFSTFVPVPAFPPSS